MELEEAVIARYLAEWHVPHTHNRTIAYVATSLRQFLQDPSDEQVRPDLLYAAEVPQDGYAFGVFAATSAECVREACERAGLAADYVSPVEEAPA